MMAPKVKEIVQTIQQLPHSEKEDILTALLKSLQVEPDVKSLADLKVQYPNEWLAVIIPEGEDRYNPQQGRLVTHNSDRSLVWQQVVDLPVDEDVYVFFTGPVATKGFGIIFHDTTDTPVVATLGN